MKYFGTDGIRGEFGENLTIELALDAAVAASKILKDIDDKCVVCIARDPRESSRSIENALVAGFTSNGVDVELFGVTTTPVISHAIITSNNKYSAGIMISASHNPFMDNGIKFFGKNGKKLSDELEAKIESLLKEGVSTKSTLELGEIKTNKSALSKYMKFVENASLDLSSLNIGLDTANGSSSVCAQEIFENLGANVKIIANEPDGKNINDNVGSTHPEKLSKLVVDNKLDFGLAFDGDGDRVMLVDHEGEVLDGDYMLYLLSKYLKDNNKLENNTIVGTVMSNIGFKEALKELDVKYEESGVGDRFVMQKMDEVNAVLGGEQSGHIIMTQYLPTGDGVLTGAFLASIFAKNIDDLKSLKQNLVKYPQTLVNMKVNDKNVIMNNEVLLNKISSLEESMNNEGRILVRASGTENLVRVMVEAKTVEKCNEISSIIEEDIKNI